MRDSTVKLPLTHVRRFRASMVLVATVRTRLETLCMPVHVAPGGMEVAVRLMLTNVRPHHARMARPAKNLALAVLWQLTLMFAFA